MDEKTVAPWQQVKGRGAQSNSSGRYEAHQRAVTHDGWDLPEEAQLLRTCVADERPRRMISYNRSPDLPFDRSINPYRGCEHG
ncbi:MAG: radical SAM protein, partial [Marinibacterium sp.]|nr:radical SAM protein [Marinibacterium sp.]